MLKWLKWIGVVGLIALLVQGVRIALFAISPYNSENHADEIIEIRPGEPFSLVAVELKDKRIIGNVNWFLFVGKVAGDLTKIKAGEYKVSARQSPWKIYELFLSGRGLLHNLLIPEGENLFQVARRVEEARLGSAKDFIDLCKNKAFIQELSLEVFPPPKSLEGYLYPDTYYFQKSATLKQIVIKMISHFKEIWTPEFSARAKEIGFTSHQVLTLASIIEKETGAPDERPLISSVFHNRLKKGMRLQSDPTIIYGIWEKYKGNLTKKDIVDVTPYNTYKISGLPPGPISNPGVDAIRAALFPETSNYLFFVSKNEGRHVFTESLSDHMAEVKKYQLDRKMREGKSWRNLNR